MAAGALSQDQGEKNKKKRKEKQRERPAGPEPLGSVGVFCPDNHLSLCCSSQLTSITVTLHL